MYNTPTHINEIFRKFQGSEKSQITAEYGEHIAVFESISPIRSINGEWSDDYKTFVNSISIETGEELQQIIHDSTKHGYNGKFGIEEKEESNSSKSIAEFNDESQTKVIIAFQYGGDEKEYAAENNDPNHQDYYDWIVIYSLNSNGLTKQIEFECA